MDAAVTATPRLPRAVRNLLIGAAVAMVVCVATFVHALAHPPAPPLPQLGQLPAFHFTDQDGKAIGLPELAGKVWVADFVFTRCPQVCPLLTERMGRIQSQTRGLDGFELVSVSVDPEFDTPAVLAKYAAAHHADPARWRFLTGKTTDIEDVVTRGFKETLEHDPNKPDDFMSIVHGGHFVLVDQKGVIRGYYDSAEPGAVEAVVADAKRLLRE